MTKIKELSLQVLMRLWQMVNTFGSSTLHVGAESSATAWENPLTVFTGASDAWTPRETQWPKRQESKTGMEMTFLDKNAYVIITRRVTT